MSETFYCRLCADLKSILDVVFINKDEGINQTIYEKILECFQVELENSFPSSVCTNCWGQANTMYDLYKKVLRAQEILRNINHENFQLKANNAVNSSIKIELEEANTNSVNMKHESAVDFEKDSFSDLDNKEDYWSDCKNDIEIEDDDDEDDEWNEPLSSIIKDALVKDEKANIKKESENQTINGIKKQKKERSADWKDSWQDYVFYCTLCTNDFTGVKELRKHYKYKHDNKSPEYKCMDCAKISTKYPLFRRHVKKHRDKFKYWCEPCNKFFHLKFRYQTHMKLVHGPCDIQKSVCPICGKSFKWPSSLENHKRYVHLPDDKKYQFECDICHKKVSSASNLTIHKKVHEDTREHTCEHCGVAFKQQGNLKQHIIHKHMDLKDLEIVQCPECPKIFKTTYSLKRHQRVHYDGDMYKCTECLREFRHKRALQRHEKIHSGILPYECEYCKKCFRGKSDLQIHLRQHTGERPYSCIECNHHFSNNSNFIKHLKGRHGLQNFSIANQRQYPFINAVVPV